MNLKSSHMCVVSSEIPISYATLFEIWKTSVGFKPTQTYAGLSQRISSDKDFRSSVSRANIYPIYRTAMLMNRILMFLMRFESTLFCMHTSNPSHSFITSPWFDLEFSFKKMAFKHFYLLLKRSSFLPCRQIIRPSKATVKINMPIGILHIYTCIQEYLDQCN